MMQLITVPIHRATNVLCSEAFSRRLVIIVFHNFLCQSVNTGKTCKRTDEKQKHRKE